MQIEAPPTDKPYSKPEDERRGIVIAHAAMTKVKHAFNAGIPAQRGIED
ncbi:MAG: hypothetical protein V4772_14240 [Pseudomonadota bacterium]